MLHVFRETVGKYVAIVIIALIAVTFIFFGIDFSITQLSYAARVNGDEIPVAEFDRLLRIEQANIQQVLRDELTDDLRREIRRSVLDQLIAREVLKQRAEEAGYRISDQRVVESLRNAPEFQAGGSFSRDIYVSRLAAEGLTPAGWEARQRDLLTIVEWQDGLLDSSFVTPAEFRRHIELLNERREIAYARFAVSDFVDQTDVTDEAIAEYHAANSDIFQTEETVDIEFIVLDLADVAETVEISESDLRDYYQSEIESYAVGEERRASHILIEPDGDDYEAAEAEAAEVLQRLEAGEDFAELAAEVSDDIGTRNFGGDLGFMVPGDFAGPFEDALFGMEIGEIAGPVETEFGYHIIRLEEVRDGDPPPFEAVRDQLQEELASDAAYSEFYDLANDLANDAYDAVDDLSSVAESYGLELETIEGLSRSGNTDRFVDPAPIVDAAFSDDAIATGENSELIQLTDERVAIIRVTGHNPPEPEPLEDVADEIRSILEREAAQVLAAEAAEAYSAALDADESGDLLAAAQSLAAEHGATWNPLAWIERDSTNVAASIVRVVFSQPPPEPGEPSVLRTGLSGGDEAVVLLNRVEPGRPEDISVTEREQQQEQLRQIAAGNEINAFATDARAEASIRVPDQILDPDL